MKYIGILIFIWLSLDVNGQRKSEKKSLERFNELYKAAMKPDQSGGSAERLRLLTSADSIMGLIPANEKLKMQCCNELLSGYIKTKDRPNVNKYLSKSKDLITALYKPDDTLFVSSLIRIARDLNTVGFREEALIIYEDCDKTFHAFPVLKRNELLYISFLESYATMMFNYEKFVPSKNIFHRAVQFVEAGSYAGSESHGRLLMLEGILHWYLNEMQETEVLFMKSKKVYEEMQGGVALNGYFELLGNLGKVLANQNRHKEADEITKVRYEFYKKQNKLESIEGASATIDYAMVLYGNKDFKSSLTLCAAAKDILEKIPEGKLTRFYWRTLYYMASCMNLEGDIVNAERILRERIELSRKIPELGKRDMGRQAVDLGQFYLSNGDYKQAEQYILQGISLTEEIFGNNHMEYFRFKKYYLHLKYVDDQDNYATAINSLNDIYNFSVLSVLSASYFLSENELEQYITELDNLDDFGFSILEKNMNTNNEVHAYNYQLFKKGFVLNSMERVKNKVNKNPDLKSKFDNLKAKQMELSKELSKPGKLRMRVDSLRYEANYLEKELARSSNDIDVELKDIKTVDLQNILNKDEACIEIVKYRFKIDLKKSIPSYGALILIKEVEKPVFVPLFRQPELDSLVSSLGSGNDFATVNAIYNSKEISALVWKNLLPHLKGINTLYVSLAGDLHRYNIHSLLIDKSRRAGDVFDIVLLNSTRDIIKLKDRSGPVIKANECLVIGDVNYDVANQSTTKQDTFEGFSITRSYTDFSQTDTLYRKSKWKALKYSAHEISSIEKKLSAAGYTVKELSQSNAQEEKIKQFNFTDSSVISPAVIHFSTHGYFFPFGRPEETGVAFKASNHPLIRSGLILSGGNNAWSGNTRQDSTEDGILTALEVSQLNLSNTDLVVLSACETGLGDISNSEGVYGLRRAFKIAGVKKMVMSLWNVSDYQTMELMDLFYINLCSKKYSPRESLYQAQKIMRRKKYEPYYWAGFVIVE